jgi:hypothetical protein
MSITPAWAIAAPKRLLEDKDVREIGKRRLVGDDAREADLPPSIESAEAQRSGDRAFDRPPRNSRRPVGAREIPVDDVEVEKGGIGRDRDFIHCGRHVLSTSSRGSVRPPKPWRRREATAAIP